MLRAEITGLDPGKLWILRWACWLAGASLRAWKARARKVREGEVEVKEGSVAR